jgi:hypothetical protein
MTTPPTAAFGPMPTASAGTHGRTSIALTTRAAAPAAA